jgi:guanylate kinase
MCTKKPRLFVISAPSGAGKTTLINRVKPRLPHLVYSISVTTRHPRAGEEEGVHYFFRTREQFLQMVAQGEMLEHMEVHGNLYGTPKHYIQAQLLQGNSVILDLDVYGKVNFDSVYPDAIGILILPPDQQELQRRLELRKTDTPETIALRLKNALAEIDFARTQGKYEYTIINDQLELAEAELFAVLTH